MMIVGCDFHPSWQQVSFFDSETGEVSERKLVNGDGEAERFYRQLPSGSLIGMEATGNSQWFVRLLERLGHEVWIGDAAEIRASYVRKQKTDKRDAEHILKLLLEKRFPKLWMPSIEQRDLRQLLIHRHKLVEIRSRVKNGLQHLMLNQGVQKKHRLWSAAGQRALRELALEGWAGRSDHGAGLCADHWRCHALPAWQAGGQLSGIDSERANIGRQAEAGIDQQAGQPLPAHAAGGGGAHGLPLRRGIS
jgi:hypothetical protein